MLYHYTSGQKLHAIRQSGGLLPIGDKHLSFDEHPLLWFSSRQDFEPSAIPQVILNGKITHLEFSEFHKLAGCYRFGSQARLMNFTKACSCAKMPKQQLEALLCASKENEWDTTNWFAAMKPILLPQLSFQKWTGSRWQDANLDEEARRCMQARNKQNFVYEGWRKPSTKGVIYT